MFKSQHGGRGGPVENLAVSTAGSTCVVALRQKLVAYNLTNPDKQVSKLDCGARWVTGMVQVSGTLTCLLLGRMVCWSGCRLARVVCCRLARVVCWPVWCVGPCAVWPAAAAGRGC